MDLKEGAECLAADFQHQKELMAEELDQDDEEETSSLMPITKSEVEQIVSWYVGRHQEHWKDTPISSVQSIQRLPDSVHVQDEWQIEKQHRSLSKRLDNLRAVIKGQAWTSRDELCNMCTSLDATMDDLQHLNRLHRRSKSVHAPLQATKELSEASPLAASATHKYTEVIDIDFDNEIEEADSDSYLRSILKPIVILSDMEDEVGKQEDDIIEVTKDERLRA